MLNSEAKRLVGAGPADLRLAPRSISSFRASPRASSSSGLAAEGKASKVGQAALVAMAHDGAILAMVGGRDYNESQFNRAVQAKRQPGSLFKTFVYLAALAERTDPAEHVGRSSGPDRRVGAGNYGGRYRGQVTLRTAFANSLNSVAVQLSETVGIQSVIEVAKKLGVQSDLPAVPSLALGSVEVTLLEMTRAFAAIAANTESVEPYGVRTILRGDQTLYTQAGGDAASPQPTSQPARHLLDLLASVVREGTGKAARLSGAGGRQDRHHPGTPRRVVRRIYPGSGGRRLGRQRRQQLRPTASPAAACRRPSGAIS